jgi:predicted DNA-binding transcriptional regulator
MIRQEEGYMDPLPILAIILVVCRVYKYIILCSQLCITEIQEQINLEILCTRHSSMNSLRRSSLHINLVQHTGQ